jgi:hypothetical protein
MKTRTHFTYWIDMLDSNDEIVEHLAGVQDYEGNLGGGNRTLAEGDHHLVPRREDRPR